MFGFGKKKKERDEKKVLVETAAAELEDLIGIIETAQTEGKDVPNIEAMSMLAYTAANFPDRPDLWERVKKIALVKGIAVVKKDNIILFTKPGSDLIDKL